MTIGTENRFVESNQGESGQIMIKVGNPGWCFIFVAALTVQTETGGHVIGVFRSFVIDPVAGIALRRGIVKSNHGFFRMTGLTRGKAMRALEGKDRFFMVERFQNNGPGNGLMAGGAILPQGSLMNVQMTIGTGSGCFGKLVLFRQSGPLVAGSTVLNRMGSCKWESGFTVIEIPQF